MRRQHLSADTRFGTCPLDRMIKTSPVIRRRESLVARFAPVDEFENSAREPCRAVTTRFIDDAPSQMLSENRLESIVEPTHVTQALPSL